MKTLNVNILLLKETAMSLENCRLHVLWNGKIDKQTEFHRGFHYLLGNSKFCNTQCAQVLLKKRGSTNIGL